MPVKQTKKQKKATAFRERKSNPTSEPFPQQDAADDINLDEAAPAIPPVIIEQAAPPSKKRKRAPEDDTTASQVKAGPEEGTSTAGAPKDPARKRKKPSKTESDPQPDADDSSAKQRFILFLGNLKYTTSLEAIQTHFSACDPPPKIRLLTPKATPGKAVAKSKGCAFLEFTHRNALQQGLKLHHSELEGRQINVELTAGGGGKSETRLQKVRERNKGLHDQRTARVEKSSKNGGNAEPLNERPQRYSATSGLEQIPLKNRTWTVGDEVDDGPTHRGGLKHKKRGKTKSKSMGTGTNSIPVG